MLTWNVRVLSLALVVALAACGDDVTGPLGQEAAPTQAAFSDDSGADAGSLQSQEASVVTDKDDYHPGDTVTITGSGFEPGETVLIHISEDPPMHPDWDFEVTADEDGGWVHRDLVMDEDHLGVTFTLTATGQSSGKVAGTVFTDGNPQSMELVESQNPDPVAPGHEATYTIRVVFDGNDTPCDVLLSVATVSGLAFSFSENPVTGQGSGGGQGGPTPAVHPESELTVAVDAAVASGTYTLVISGSNESGCQGPGPDDLTLDLVVTGDDDPDPDAPTTTTVSDATATYGDATVTLTATVTNGETIDDGEVTVTLKDGDDNTIGSATAGSVEDGEATVEYDIPEGTPAGTYTIEASFGGAPGFEASAATAGTLTIDPLGITGSFTAEDKVYDGTTDAEVESRSLDGVLFDDDVELTGGTATFDTKDVGEDKIVTLTGATLAGDDAGNYTLTSVETTTADITAAPLTATADDIVRNFSDTHDVVLTASYSGWVPGEDESLIQGTPNLSTNGGPGSDAGTYHIEWDDPEGVSAPNYDITFVDGTLTIHDDVPPVVSDLELDPTFVAVDEGTAVLRALVSDASTGNSDIGSAEYSTDGGFTWSPMSAEDGAFDSPTEWVTIELGTFSEPGLVNVCVRGTDAGSETTEGGTNNTSDGEDCIYLAVVDPSAGFVTGGGWIDSPSGAYRPDDQTLNPTGRANFGFVSRYKKGANRPDGNTEFQFKAGNLNFHSSDYEWLVVNQGGERAQFKGTGTVNGEGGFDFMLWAQDRDDADGGDTFRIQITDASGAVVYDNYALGSAEDYGDTTLGGGSIVIHTGGNGQGKGNR